MLITCPNCTTSYQIATADLGAAGRSVRCVRCRTLWHAMPMSAQPAHAGGEDDISDETVDAFRAELHGDAEPPPEMSSPNLAADAPDDDALDLNAENARPDQTEPDGPIETDLQAAADDPQPLIAQEIPADEAPPLAPVLEHGPPTKPAKAAPALAPGVETAARRAPRRRSGTSRGLLLPLIIVGMVTVLGALLIGRNSVVNSAPQTASLYAALGLPVNVRGLDFVDVRTSADTHDGVPVLLVEGAIVNRAATSIKVPRLRFGVNNEAGNEIYAWTAQPAQPALQPGETLPFRSRLASPPPEGRTVLVRFFHPRDAASGLR